MTSFPPAPKRSLTSSHPNNFSIISSLSEQLQESLLICNREYMICYANQQAITSWNHSREQLIGLDFRDAIYLLDRPAYIEAFEMIAKHPQPKTTSFKKLSNTVLDSVQTQTTNAVTPARLTVRLAKSDSSHKQIDLRLSCFECNNESFVIHLFSNFTPKAIDETTGSLPKNGLLATSMQCAVRVDESGTIVEETELFKNLVDSAHTRSLKGLQIQNILELDYRKQGKPLKVYHDSLRSRLSGRLKRAGGRTLPIKIDLLRSTWQGKPALLYAIVKDSMIIWTTMVNKFSLTQRESDVVLELCKGQTSTALASQLNISPATVRTHLRNIFTKVGVNSRVKLVSLIFNTLINQMVPNQTEDSEGYEPKSVARSPCDAARTTAVVP